MQNNRMPALYFVGPIGEWADFYDCAVEEWDPSAEDYAEHLGEAPPEEHEGIVRSFKLNNPQHLRALADLLDSYLDAPETI